MIDTGSSKYLTKYAADEYMLLRIYQVTGEELKIIDKMGTHKGVIERESVYVLGQTNEYKAEMYLLQHEPTIKKLISNQERKNAHRTTQ